jgi:hypothetical protein
VRCEGSWDAARSPHSRSHLNRLQKGTCNFGGLHHQPKMNSPSLRALWRERGESSVVSASTPDGESARSESEQVKRSISISALDPRPFDRAACGSTWAGGCVFETGLIAVSTRSTVSPENRRVLW